MAAYLYGIVPAGAAAPAVAGVHDRPVDVVPAGNGLALVRSDVDDDRVQPRRAHLVAHDRVLAAAMAAGPVLPLRFGVVTEHDAATVAAELDEERVRDRMAVLDGRVEVQLLWDLAEDVAVERVVAAAPQVRDPALGDLDRGRVVSEVMASLAATDVARIALRLGGRIVTRGEVEERGTSGARVALLVDAARVDDLLEACRELAEEVAVAGTLRTVGALPPYSFADLHVELDGQVA